MLDVDGGVAGGVRREIGVLESMLLNKRAIGLSSLLFPFVFEGGELYGGVGRVEGRGGGLGVDGWSVGEE